MSFSGQVSQRLTKFDGVECIRGPLWAWSTTGTGATVDWQLWVLTPPPREPPTWRFHYPGGSPSVSVAYDDGANPDATYDYQWLPSSGSLTLSWTRDHGRLPADQVTATRLVISADMSLRPTPNSSFEESTGLSSNLATAPETIKGTWACERR
jgi:hypothetical protein